MGLTRCTNKQQHKKKKKNYKTEQTNYQTTNNKQTNNKQTTNKKQQTNNKQKTANKQTTHDKRLNNKKDSTTNKQQPTNIQQTPTPPPRYNKQPTNQQTNNKRQQTTNNQHHQQTTHNKHTHQQSTNNNNTTKVQPTNQRTNQPRTTNDDEQQTTNNRQHTTHNTQHTTHNTQHTTHNTPKSGGGPAWRPTRRVCFAFSRSKFHSVFPYLGVFSRNFGGGRSSGSPGALWRPDSSEGCPGGGVLGEDGPGGRRGPVGDWERGRSQRRPYGGTSAKKAENQERSLERAVQELGVAVKRDLTPKYERPHQGNYTDGRLARLSIHSSFFLLKKKNAHTCALEKKTPL